MHTSTSTVVEFDPRPSRAPKRCCELARIALARKALTGKASASPYQTGAVQSSGEPSPNRERFAAVRVNASSEVQAKTLGAPGLLSPSSSSGDICAEVSWRRERNSEAQYVCPLRGARTSSLRMLTRNSDGVTLVHCHAWRPSSDLGH
jgi:hypothetical protein